MRVLISALMRPYTSVLHCKSIYKRFSHKSTGLRCLRLKDRRVIGVKGQDTASFLQGLITNDVKLLEDRTRPALYTHMLNIQGRTLYDLIIYRLKEGPGGVEEALIECDASVLDSLSSHLKTYKIRRKVVVQPHADLALWALLDSTGDSLSPMPEVREENKVVAMVHDPRTHLMGWRLVTRNQENPADIVTQCIHGDDDDEYHRHRYKLGVPEGVRDLPPGDALPLEANLVFLNGISFAKGCYIGQELTARTNHTGVIRKRLMPVRLSVPVEELPLGSAIESEQGKAAGKLRSGVGELALGLVRLSHAHETLKIKSQGATLTATVPDWWPQEFKKNL